MRNFRVYGCFYMVPDRAPERWRVDEIPLSGWVDEAKARELAQAETRIEYTRGCTCLSVRVETRDKKIVWQWYHD